MLITFDNSLHSLAGQLAEVSAGNQYPEPEQASIKLSFAHGAVLEAAYWRLIEHHKASLSSFDHGQQYGSPAPINAVEQLQASLNGRLVQSAHLDGETGDLIFLFKREIKLQFFNFTSYEIWGLRFPDGTGEYSNDCK
jgi:hypothetical protein